MSDKTPSSEYLAICRGSWNPDMTPADIEKAFEDFYAWFERLVDEGKMRPGQRLADEGKVVTGGNSVTDGPFTESKEVVGGFWFVVADSLDEAAKIVAGDPCLKHGLTVEVRPIIQE